MRNIDIIRISWKNLKANKMRTFLTVLGISVGIATIVFLVSLGFGLQELSIRKISSISSLTSLDVIPSQGSVSITGELVKELSKIGNVEKVSPFLSLTGKLSNQKSNADIVANATNSDYFSLQGLKLSQGGPFLEEDANWVVLSSATVKALNATADELLGKTINFNGFVIKSDGQLSNIALDLKICGVIDDNSSTYVYLPLNSVKNSLNDQTVYNSAKVKVNNKDNIGEVKSALEAKGLKVTSVADTIGQIYQFFSIVQIILAVFGAVALVVASIGMFNTMTVALLERTRDIGIMKAIGVQNSTVNKMFVSESFLISFLGGLFGIFLGLATGQIINLIINILAKSVGGEAEKIFSTPLYVIGVIFAFSLLVGITTGFYPAKRASRLNPLDALRYE